MNGKKISLRPLLKEDIVLLNQWKNDEEVYRFLGGGFAPTSIDQQSKWMDSMIDQTGNSRRFMIVSQEGAVGMVGLYDINWVHRTCEIGVFIGERLGQRRGYAREACTLLEEYAGNYLNLRKIKLYVVADNEAGLALWTKLGYRQAGRLCAERFIQGRYHDLLIMEKFLDSTSCEEGTQ